MAGVIKFGFSLRTPLKTSTIIEGSQTRFGGMRDLPFSVMIFATGFELKTRAGSGNYTYERERDLVFLWLWDAGFVRGIE